MTLTPKQKAKELLDRIMPLSNPLNDGKYKDNMNRSIHVKEICHIICDEVLSVHKSGFWMNVKKEIDIL